MGYLDEKASAQYLYVLDGLLEDQGFADFDGRGRGSVVPGSG